MGFFKKETDKDKRILELEKELEIIEKRNTFHNIMNAEILKVKEESYKQQIAAWKDRGDRYASANTELQKVMLKLNETLADVIKNPETLAAYKESLNILTKKKEDKTNEKK